jgi:3-dehydroquinate dehydratase-1
MNRLPISVVVSTRSKEEVENAALLGADLIEIRLDLVTAPAVTPGMLDGLVVPPLIITVRSETEGGRFHGSVEEWQRQVEPWLDMAAYVDAETAYRAPAEEFRARGIPVISSWHTSLMPTLPELHRMERLLRSFGDIPKMVATPVTPADLLTLLSFTLEAEKPICTGITGSRFRFGRVLLPLFGSRLVYCHAGVPTAEGQYHVQDFRTLFENLLK